MKYLLLFILLFTACEDKTYSRIYKKDEIGTHIPSLTVSEINQTIKSIVINALKETDFKVTTGAPYVLEIEGATYPKKCNNPNTSAYDATYDGYLKLTLLKNMQRIYTCQKDFHGVLNKTVVRDLIEKMQDDLAIESSTL